MKKLESSLKNMVIVLTVVSVVAATILAFINEQTKTTIANRASIALANGIKSVMGDDQLKVVQTDTVGGKYVVFTTENAKGEYLGVAVQAEEIGFGGIIRVLVGFNTEDAITGYTVLSHVETPGLGSKAGTWFQADGKGSIIGKTPAPALAVTKDGGDVDAITASTITSRAFLKAINAAYETYKELKSVPAATAVATEDTKIEKE